MRFASLCGLALVGLLSLRCDGGAPVDEALGGAGGAVASGGAAATGGGLSTGGSGDCATENCCLAKETYCKGDEIWRRPLDSACDQPAELIEACEYACTVSTLYQIAYCEDAPQGGAGGLGGAGGAGD